MSRYRLTPSRGQRLALAIARLSAAGLLDWVRRAVARRGASLEAVLGGARRSAPVRQEIVHVIKNSTGLSYPKIGELLGGYDHTTMMNADDVYSCKLAEMHGAERSGRKLRSPKRFHRPDPALLELVAVRERVLGS